ncbi:MAG: flagellin [Candidatus Ozemobacteraceae bacterium]
MAMRINQNPTALRVVGGLSTTDTRLEKSIGKISSGLRINSAADDPAGLSFSEKLRRQIHGLSRAGSNVQDGISMIQTGEGALSDTQDILQRMRELAVQAGNDTLSGTDRFEIQKEVNQLRDDLNRIAANTEFNTKRLLDGSQNALVSSSSNAARGIVRGSEEASAGDFNISIALIAGGISQMSRSQIFGKRGGGSTALAVGSTELQSIAQFYDANDLFLVETSQTLILQGGGKSASLQIDKRMTLDQLAAGIQNAVSTVSGLNLGRSSVSVISTAQTNVAGMGGYIEMATGVNGDAGRVTFLADSPLLTGLGFSTVRDPVNNVVQLTMRDAFGGTRQVRTATDRVVGLLDGIDVKFSSQAAQIAGTRGIQSGLHMSAGQFLRISAGGSGFANVTVSFGPGYYSMEGLARSINAQIGTLTATAVNGLEASVVEGQLRLSYTPQPSTTADSTLTLSSASAAPTLGFLSDTYTGFISGNKDSRKSVDGFSIYVATGTGGFAINQVMRFQLSDGQKGPITVKFVPASYTATGSLASASATAADLVRFVDFQSTANQQLAAASIQVRVDQIGNAMAFTSLRVGSEVPDGTAPKLSQVDMDISAVSANADAISYFANLFGMSKSSFAVGAGEKNFKFHVVDNRPQLQIGDSSGQIMRLGFGEMDAEALGVESLDLTSISGANRAVSVINAAIDKVSSERSRLGAYQNRLESTMLGLQNSFGNLTAAESRVRDIDIAEEMIEFTRNQIVSQTGTAMVAQATISPASVLDLLR